MSVTLLGCRERREAMSTELNQAEQGWRAWCMNFIIFVSSLTLCLVLFEVMLIFMIPPPIVWRDPQEGYLHDPDLMHRLKPNQGAYTHSFPVHTNSYGLRDREFPIQAELGTVRILCLGDSLTFGNGVAMESTWPKQLEGLLNGTFNGVRYQTINAGVSAYDTWQEIGYLERHGIQFQPSVVIVGFYANDVVPKPTVMPKTLSDRGSLQRQGWKAYVSDEVAHVLKRSRTLLFMRDRLDKLANLIRPSGFHSHKEAMLLGINDEFVEAGWKEVERSFDRLVALGRKGKFQTMIVMFPMEDQIAGTYGTQGYQDRLKNLAEKVGIPVVDLTASFHAAFKGFDSLFIPWDGHPNARAYGIAAREIQQAIEQNLEFRQ